MPDYTYQVATPASTVLVSLVEAEEEEDVDEAKSTHDVKYVHPATEPALSVSVQHPKRCDWLLYPHSPMGQM